MACMTQHFPLFLSVCPGIFFLMFSIFSSNWSITAGLKSSWKPLLWFQRGGYLDIGDTTCFSRGRGNLMVSVYWTVWLICPSCQWGGGREKKNKNKTECAREQEKINVLMSLETAFWIIENRELNKDLKSPVLSVIFVLFREQTHVLTFQLVFSEGSVQKQHYFLRKQNSPPASSPGLSPSSTFKFQNMALKNPSYLYRTPFCFAWNFHRIYLGLADKNVGVCPILLPQIPLNPNPWSPLYPHPSQKSGTATNKFWLMN